jgi:uridine phosphorylase
MDEDVLIEPRKRPDDPRIDHPVLLALFEPYVEILRKKMKMKKSALVRRRFPSVNFGTKKIAGQKISLVGAPLGSPYAAILLERLIAMGAKDVVALGCCGSLQPNLKVGHLVIPREALSEEGTSGHYPLPKGTGRKTDDQLVALLQKKCRHRKIPWTEGKIWTTDALFRETREKVARYSKKGLLAVEMEMSALMTVAAYRRIRFAALLVVSDELAGPGWKTGFLNPSFWSASEEAAKMLIELSPDLKSR